MIQQSFILCAGKATRLHPLTLDHPKCLLKVGELTVLDLIIDWLESQNIFRHVCNVYWQSEKIKEHISKVKKNIIAVEENDLLGTFGGLVNALHMLDDIFLVVYGDTITNCKINELVKFHKSNSADVTLASSESDMPWSGGVVIGDSHGKVFEIIEKPNCDNCPSNLVNAGVIVFNRNIIEKYKGFGFKDIAKDFLPKAIKDNHRIFHYNISPDGFFIDMGTVDNYNKLKEFYNDSNTNTIANKLFGRRQRSSGIL